jgi:DNA-binding CsgD family transcriptional regulator
MTSLRLTAPVSLTVMGEQTGEPHQGRPITDLVNRARHACDTAGPASGDRPTARELDEISGSIRAALRSGDAEAAESSELIALLARLARTRATQLRESGHEGLQRLAEIYEQLGRLRTHSSVDALLDAAPAAALVCCPFDRIFVSRVHGDSWTVRSHSGPDRAIRTSTSDPRHVSLPLGDHAEGRVVHLGRALLAGNGRTVANPKFRKLTRGSLFAIAPVVSAGQVAALMHADRVPPSPIADHELRQLSAFAQGLGLHLDACRLRRVLNGQRDRLEATMATAPGQSEQWLPILQDPAADAVDPGPGDHSVDGGRSMIALVLSPRELEVMALVARGFRNAQIAERLVVSEATIKSHVSRSMRKLRVSNRTQAIARYLSLTTGKDPTCPA